MKKIVLLCLLLALNGCIPRYATIRPQYDVDVRNPQGAPITNATMWVMTTRMPPGYTPQIAAFHADTQGHIQVDKKSQWERIIFFIHGTNFYRFHWCIEAPGYLPRSGDSALIGTPLTLTPARQPTRCDASIRGEGDFYK